MVEEPETEPSETGGNRRRFGIRTLLGSGIVAFLLGAALIAWISWRDDGVLVTEPIDATWPSELDVPQTEPETAPTPSETEALKNVQTAQAVEKVAQQQGGFDQRLAALEQRLVRLDLQANAAAGNAARAEALLIAFAARRAIERGAPLGYLADQLRLRFGDARPNAVRTIIESSRKPVTLDQLIARLEGLSSKLSRAPSDEGFFDRLQREFGDLFVVRRESSPSPAPQRRLERARLFLESGRIEAAAAEVRNLPGAQEGDAWIADAERYAAVQTALDLIETTAVLEPRDLRDGKGNKVEQRSPAG